MVTSFSSDFASFSSNFALSSSNSTRSSSSAVTFISCPDQQDLGPMAHKSWNLKQIHQESGATASMSQSSFCSSFSRKEVLKMLRFRLFCSVSATHFLGQISFWKLKSLNFIFWKSKSKPSACLMSQAAQPWALARPCPPLPFTVTDGAPSVQEAAAHRPVSSQWVLAFDVPVAVWPAPVHQSDWVSHPWQSGVWGDTRICKSLWKNERCVIKHW